MDVSQMRNIIVLKDIPSNIVDEAIVILKNNNVIKKKEIVESKALNKFEEDNNKDFILREAENVINNYVEKIEKPKEKNNFNKILIKYKKLRVYSFFLGIIAFIGIIVSIIK